MNVDELLKKAEKDLLSQEGNKNLDRDVTMLRGIGYALMALVLTLRDQQKTK